MLTTFLTIVHVLVAVAIIGLVLLQRGKGAEAGAGFGSGASGTVFGARGSATFFSKTTAVLVTCFFVTSLSLAYLATHRPAGPKSVLDQVPAAPAVVPPPAAPATLPVAPAPADKAP
jgi:preprotein translocase subunit SecG